MKEWEKFRQAWKVVSSELRPLKKQNVQDGGREKSLYISFSHQMLLLSRGKDSVYLTD